MSSFAEGELAIDEIGSTVSLTPNPCVVTDLTVAAREEEERVSDFFDHLSGDKSAPSHQVLGGGVDEDDSFVDIMSCNTAIGDAESEVWTFVDALAHTNISVKTIV